MGRLIISRRPGEAVVVGDTVFRVIKIRSDQCNVMIESADENKILREELIDPERAQRNLEIAYLTRLVGTLRGRERHAVDRRIAALIKRDRQCYLSE